MTVPTELVVVKPQRLPVDIFRQASEHQDELRRGSALIQHSESLDSEDVSRRLLRLIDELDTHFTAFSEESSTARLAASPSTS